MKKKIELGMGLFLILAAVLFARKGAVLVQKLDKPSSCIVIDAGHGGDDPGKIGINNALEKEINLQIAQKLCDLLSASSISAVMTRPTDAGLYSASATNKKVDDMQKRCLLIEDTNPLFTVSIHQNSYPSPEISGAQVFYYTQSLEGKKLAECIQAELIRQLDPDNHREAKANDSYYLLKKTSSPTVIVECGFLSNPTEADLLCDSDYQDLVATAVCSGIQNYLAGGLPSEIPSSEAPQEPLFSTEQR